MHRTVYMLEKKKDQNATAKMTIITATVATHVRALRMLRRILGSLALTPKSLSLKPRNTQTPNLAQGLP